MIPKGRQVKIAARLATRNDGGSGEHIAMATVNLPAGAVTLCAVLAQIVGRIIASEGSDPMPTTTATPIGVV